MSDYEIRFTDSSKAPIIVGENSIDRNSVDISLIGRIFQNYGEDINTSLLNILENFACPELFDVPSNPDDDPILPPAEDAVPNLSATSLTQLHNPVEGQFWYNSTRKVIYFFDSTKWVPLDNRGSYAANWGVISHGQSLPKPVNVFTGYTFDYDECIWTVSPTVFPGSIDGFNCSTNNEALVTTQLRYTNTEAFVDSIANYLIIGIRRNTNIGGGNYPPPLMPSPTPTPSPSATVTVTPTATPEPSQTQTPIVSETPTATVTATPTETPPVTPTRTPIVTATGTPPVSVTPTVSDTPAVTPTPTPSMVDLSSCSGGEIQAFDPGGTGALATGKIEFNTNGSCARTSSTTGTQNGTWLLSGNAADYEIRATLADMPNIDGSHTNMYGPVDVWLNMGVTRTWEAAVGPMDDNGQYGSIDWSLDLEIRLISTGTIVATGSVRFLVAVGFIP